MKLSPDLYWHGKIEKYEKRKSSFLSREMGISQKIKGYSVLKGMEWLNQNDDKSFQNVVS